MLTRPEYHDLKNHMAIGIGMVELLTKMLKKLPPSDETQKLIERAEKSSAAFEKAMVLINTGHERAKKEESVP